jgi:pyrroline-5-carboxylate reductase
MAAISTDTLGFLGGGQMAEALIGAFISSGQVSADALYASDPQEDRRSRLSDSYGIHTLDDNAALVPQCNVVFLATKPQILTGAMESIAASFGARHLVISIAAGITIDYLENLLPESRVVRVMPNTPCLVGAMAAGYAMGNRTTAADENLVARLLESAGIAFKLPEDQLDAVTGLSGSGPAFVARLIEAMAAGGTAQGLPQDVAEQLALQTVLGTGKLLRDKNLSPDALVKMVSSPNGTTVAGRAVLESSDVADVMRATIAAATQRSKELAKG